MTLPLQYSCLENSMDRRSWCATVYEKSQTWLSRWVHTRTHTHAAKDILPSFKQCLDWRIAKLVSRYTKPVISLTHWPGILLVHVGSPVDARWKRQTLIFCIPGHSRGWPVNGIDASAAAVWYICTLDIIQVKSSIISESENSKYLFRVWQIQDHT